MSADGATVLLSSHTLSEVERVTDRLAVLRRGRLVVVDSVENLRGIATQGWRSSSRRRRRRGVQRAAERRLGCCRGNRPDGQLRGVRRPCDQSVPRPMRCAPSVRVKTTWRTSSCAITRRTRSEPPDLRAVAAPATDRRIDGRRGADRDHGGGGRPVPGCRAHDRRPACPRRASPTCSAEPTTER